MTGLPGRRSSYGQRVGCCSLRTFLAWRNCAEKSDSFGDVVGGRGRDVDAVSAIAFGSGANVSAINAVTGLGAADCRVFLDKHAHSGWGKRLGIEVVGDVELGFGGKAQVDAGRPDHI